MFASALLFLAVLIPAGFILNSKSLPDKLIKLLLAFSGAYLLGLCFMHLLPEVYQAGVNKIGLWILLGFVIQLLLEFLSQGVEHGHAHTSTQFGKYFPLVLLISLSLHSITEIFSLHFEGAAHHHHHESIGLVSGFVLHKIPVAITLASIFKKSALTKTQTWLSITVFGLSAPLGIFLGEYLKTEALVGPNFFAIITSIAVGIILHISTTILFESNQGHRFNYAKFGTVALGLALSYFLV